ncbi:MAG TPA: HypC/HybG/HupF family hydrogenase formation chaperone [Thermoleophilia bacterium]|nr:HypC/HybG/HupF family hydrogenase formation chaperone [Thermoleophilia bacterium]
MCLAIPARIASIDGIMGVIDLDGVRREVSLILCPGAEVGQYALVHAGFAISVIDEEQAQLGLDTFEEFRRLLEEGAA